jgi:ABC-2 type transport system permease protein
MSPALRAEWAKVRCLPLPRFLVLAVFVAAVAGAVVTLNAPSGTPATVADHARLGLLAAGTFATVIFAVWIYGLETAQGTLGQTFLAEPRRGRVIRAKALLATALPIAAVSLAALAIAPITAAAINRHGGDVGVLDVLADLPAVVAPIALVAPTCFGLALITGRMTAGIVASLVLIEILPGIFAVSGLRGASLTITLNDFATGVIRDTGGVSFLHALAVCAVWSVAAVGIGAACVRARDVR